MLPSLLRREPTTIVLWQWLYSTCQTGLHLSRHGCSETFTSPGRCHVIRITLRRPLHDAKGPSPAGKARDGSWLSPRGLGDFLSAADATAKSGNKRRICATADSALYGCSCWWQRVSGFRKCSPLRATWIPVFACSLKDWPPDPLRTVFNSLFYHVTLC